VCFFIATGSFENDLSRRRAFRGPGGDLANGPSGRPLFRMRPEAILQSTGLSDVIAVILRIPLQAEHRLEALLIPWRRQCREFRAQEGTETTLGSVVF